MRQEQLAQDGQVKREIAPDHPFPVRHVRLKVSEPGSVTRYDQRHPL
jgi:hypothetical protein